MRNKKTVTIIVMFIMSNLGWVSKFVIFQGIGPSLKRY